MVAPSSIVSLPILALAILVPAGPLPQQKDGSKTRGGCNTYLQEEGRWVKRRLGTTGCVQSLPPAWRKGGTLWGGRSGETQQVLSVAQ